MVDVARLKITGAELKVGDQIIHPDDRVVYTVLQEPIADPGTWQLGCRCRNRAGRVVVISVPPTAPMEVER